MRAVFGLVLVLGLGLAGAAVYMARGFISENAERQAQAEAALAAMVETVEVYAAKTRLEYGDTITPDTIQVIRYAEEYLPEGVFFTKEEMFPQGEDVLRIALRPIEPNEVLLDVKMTEPGEDAGLTQRLGAGMRAFAIRVDVTSGVGGFLRPGDRVDVYWSGRANGANGGNEFTRLIESRVQIIAVDQSSDGNRQEARVARTVTVEVSPTQVAALAQAQATGNLTLSLVGTNDDSIASSIEVDTKRLLGITEQEIVEVEAERVCTIRTRRGAEVVEIPITCTN